MIKLNCIGCIGHHLTAIVDDYIRRVDLCKTYTPPRLAEAKEIINVLEFEDSMSLPLLVNIGTSNFLYNVARKRAEYLKLKISSRALLVLAEAADNPAKVVVMLVVLKHLQMAEVEPAIIRVADVLANIAWLDDKNFSELWASQKLVPNANKYGTDNLMDLVDPDRDFLMQPNFVGCEVCGAEHV